MQKIKRGERCAQDRSSDKRTAQMHQDCRLPQTYNMPPMEQWQFLLSAITSPLLKHGYYNAHNSLLSKPFCITLYDMKSAITIRLDPELDQMLSKVTRNLGRSRSEIVRDSLRRQLSIFIFDDLRDKAIPYAEKKGYFTDDDIFREIS